MLSTYNFSDKNIVVTNKLYLSYKLSLLKPNPKVNNKNLVILLYLYATKGTLCLNSAK